MADPTWDDKPESDWVTREKELFYLERIAWLTAHGVSDG